MEDNIGKFELYYCKSCLFHSTEIQDIVEHQKSSKCTGQKASVDAVPANVLTNAALMHLEQEERDNVCTISTASEGLSKTNLSSVEKLSTLSDKDATEVKLFEQTAIVDEAEGKLSESCNMKSEIHIQSGTIENDQIIIEVLEGNNANISGFQLPRESDSFTSSKPSVSDVFSCDKCDVKFHSKKDFLQHCKDSRGQVNCMKDKNVCKVFEPDDSSLHKTEPLLIPEQATAEKCNDGKYSVLRKKRGRKPIKMEPSTVVKCVHCYKKFANQERLDQHCAKMHTAQKMQPVVCETCGRSFRNNIQRRNHVRQVHEGVKRKPSKPPTNQQLYMCSICSYMTPIKKRLINHQLADHQGIMPYHCDLCSYASKEKSDMNRHKLRHAELKKYACEHCDYRTTERWILVNHCSKQHNVELPRKTRDTMGCAMSKRWQARQQKGIVQYACRTASTDLTECTSTEKSRTLAPMEYSKKHATNPKMSTEHTGQNVNLKPVILDISHFKNDQNQLDMSNVEIQNVRSNFVRDAPVVEIPTTVEVMNPQGSNPDVAQVHLAVQSIEVDQTGSCHDNKHGEVIEDHVVVGGDEMASVVYVEGQEDAMYVLFTEGSVEEVKPATESNNE